MLYAWDEGPDVYVVAVVRRALGSRLRFCDSNTLVGDDTLNVVAVFIELHVAGLDDGTHPVVACWLIGVDHDVVTLPTTNQDARRFKWLDRHKIHSDDGEFMSIHAEAQETVCLGTDKAHTVFLPRLELDLKALASAFAVLVADV